MGTVWITALLALAAIAAAPSSASAQLAHPVLSAAPEEAECLATAIYYEAGFEPRAGREAVAQVILNRLTDPRFPKTVCGVVRQGPARRGGGCQFSFTCDGSERRARDPRAWAEAHEIAAEVLQRGSPTPVAANHYHADYVHPRWAGQMTMLTRIGRHIFYTDRSAGAQAAAALNAAALKAASAQQREPFSLWGLAPAAVSAPAPAPSTSAPELASATPSTSVF